MSISLPIVVSSAYATIFRHFFLGICLLCFSSFSLAQPQVVTQTLINQYGLDLSDPEPEAIAYELLVGSNGALYLRDNSNNSYKKISKRMNGVPAKVETGFPGNSQTYFQADKIFDRIVYVSKDPNITPGDSGDSEDVFIYSVSEDKTIRIEGNKPHEGTIRQVRINDEGDKVAFGSIDWYFGDISKLDTSGVSLDQFNGVVGLVYLSNIIDFSSGAGLPFTPRVNVYPNNPGLYLCGEECQFFGDSITFLVNASYPLAEYFWNLIYDYDIRKETFTRVVERYNDERTDNIYSTKNLDDSRHILVETNESQLIDYFGVINSFVYDTWLNDRYSFTEDFPLILYNGFNFDDSFQKVYGAISQNSRYLTFHAKKLEYIDGDEQYPEYNTGIIYVYDTWAGELRQAFTVDRTALSFAGYFNNLLGKMTCINCDGIDDYEIEPVNIRFHNNNQYITFEANSWYLDPTVPYASFAVPYARDLFVVANPFNNDEDQATCGAPDTTVSADGDTYLWRDCATGQWHLQITGSDSVQILTGKIVADQGINNIVAENLDTADSYTSSSTELGFDLGVQTGDEDGFSFYLTSLTGTCIDITNSDTVNVRVGARQIALPVPFDLKTLEPVSDCGDDGSIAVDGAPAIDYTTDQGWFIWRENGIWQSRFSAGGSEIQFIGSLESSQPMLNLQPNSIEPRDMLALNPATLVNFNVYVTGPYRDGFSVAISNSANTCASLSSPSGVNIYLGPDAVMMPNSFDLNTLTDCGTTPDIETLGKPAIDRTADNGIFLWENSDHNWQVEVVSGSIRRTIDIDVLSQQALSNIEQINIENNDVFTIMAMSLDLSLRVRSPWHDGFKFVEQDQSSTCVSTTNADVPIYLGPDRVNVGNSINLSTQTSCP